MSFAVHTFETHPDGSNTAFAFHENLGEGQEVYFLAKFPAGEDSARIAAETIFGAIVDALKFDARGEAGDRFEDALKAANNQAQKLGLLRKERPDIVVSFFDFQTLYVATSGEGQSSLIRSGAMSRITEEINGADLFNNLLSGQVAVDDVIVVSNKNPLAVIPASQMGEILSRENFDDAVSAVRHELTTKSSVDLLVTILGIGKKSASGTAGFLSKMVSKISSSSEETEPVVSVPKRVLEETTNEAAPLDKVSSPTKVTKNDSEDKKKKIIEPQKEPEPVVSEAQEELFAEQEEAGEPGITNDFEEEYAPREPGKLAIKWSKVRQKASQLTLKQIKMAAGGVLGILILVLGIRFLTSFETQETSQLREQDYSFRNIPSTPFSGQNIKIFTTESIDFQLIENSVKVVIEPIKKRCEKFLLI